MNVTQLSKYAGDRIRSKNQQGQHYKAPSIKNTKSCLEASINAAQQAHYTFYVRQTRRCSKALYQCEILTRYQPHPLKTIQANTGGKKIFVNEGNSAVEVCEG